MAVWTGVNPDATRFSVFVSGLSNVWSIAEIPPDNKQVKVPHKIPVYITYFTTYTNNGQLYFGNDLYNRDDKLVPIMMSAAFPKKNVVDAVQALRRIASA